MKVFLDTNVLIAAVIEKHAEHERAYAVLQRVQIGKDEGFISAHGVAEIYANLTRFPPPYRHSPEQALLSIEENVLNYFNISSLTGHDYRAVIRESALAGIQGGAIYDAVLLRSAAKAGVDRVYTLNLKHFQAVAPRDFRSKILMP